jgi:hypothetical protein
MKIALQFEKRYLWVGVFWDTERLAWGEPHERGGGRGFLNRTKVYVCLVPTLPIVLTFDRKEKP